MWVFKIGGSLARARELFPWLNGLATIAAGQAVIVPGGGPFADAVKQLQGIRRFSDTVAHEMALLGMEQYGLMMCDLEPRLVAAHHRDEIVAALSAGRVPVWLPRDMLRGVEEIPRSWELSSDSVAAWLSGVLGVGHLGLVKSVSPPSEPRTAPALARLGVVDSVFPRMHAGLLCQAWWLGRRHYRHIRELINGGAAGCRIVAAEPPPTQCLRRW